MNTDKPMTRKELNAAAAKIGIAPCALDYRIKHWGIEKALSIKKLSSSERGARGAKKSPWRHPGSK